MIVRSLILLLLLPCCLKASGGAQTRIQWDRKTLTLIAPGGGYGRMARLRDGSLLCAYEGPGGILTRRSRNLGGTWEQPVLAATFAHGAAANPELLALRDGRLWLLYNERPVDGRHPFSIRLTVSADDGQTWKLRPPLYTADTDPKNGCWEPAAIQLPSGEIQVFFANENPYRNSDEQEITLLRSRDYGATWSAPRAVSFRAGKRDGMPVPLLLQNGAGIALAIEDNGLPTNMLQPAIVWTSLRDNWTQPCAGGDSPRRWWAHAPRLPESLYAGAPYLRQLPSGETLLSCQRREEGRGEPQMAVSIGDAQARSFAGESRPFEGTGAIGCYWNSLFVKDRDTVTALAGTTIQGKSGLWAIDGHVVRSSRPGNTR